MDPVTLTRDGPVAVLTLARPPFNALDRGGLDALSAALGEVERDREARVLVVAGGLDGIFCSGGDLKYWRTVSDAGAVRRAGREVFDSLLPLHGAESLPGKAGAGSGRTHREYLVE